MSIQQRIAKLLSKQDAPLSHAACKENIAAINQRLDEIRTRCALIDPEPTAKGKLSEERRRIAETGSPEDLVALDNEFSLLEAEDYSLCTQRDALKKRAEAAKAEEAVGHAKTALKRLPETLAAAEKAIQDHDSAITALKALQGEIVEHRRVAAAAGHKPPALSEDVFDRLAAALGWTAPSQPQTYPENRARALQHNRKALVDNPWPENPSIHPDLTSRVAG